ncbi:MAG: hypothetical protein K2X29_05730 [Candidatus Obscuribacterales bacterium]|nr:hypothetical protein [Candidatus Obscuribacterales bacterium]
MIFANLALGLVLSGCSYKNDQAATKRGSGNPVLTVEQQEYRFSMYPQYVDESKSLLKLNIRDKEDHFVKGARATANLKADDGHVQRVEFREDPALQRYIADVPLKHHEDYVVNTEVSLQKETFRPEFIFHCGDPVPELVELRQEGSENK